MLRKWMDMLGLSDEGDLEEPQPGYGPEPERAPARERPPAPQSNVSSVTPVNPVPSSSEEPSGLGAVRPIRSNDRPDRTGGTGSTPTVRAKVVRPVPMAANAKPHKVAPTSFNQAQNVADAYKVNQPVIMDLQGADRELSRRLIDFASGLCYGLGGQMERLDSQVYLLTPTNVTVSDEERRRLRERGFDA